VKSISWRVQLGFVLLVYAAVSVIAAAILYGRHLQELKYPAEASGGMWAAGDAMLYIFIACLFMIPTGFLIWFIAKFETLYKAYSQLLLALSLSAPICLSLISLGENHVAEGLANFCLERLFWSPFVLVAIGVSRLAARFDRAKRFVTYALLIEGMTLGVAVALIIRAAGASGR
jgi:hypothetical protein